MVLGKFHPFLTHFKFLSALQWLLHGNNWMHQRSDFLEQLIDRNNI